MEVINKQLHKHALPIALVIMLLITLSSAAILNRESSGDIADALGKRAIQINSKDSDNYGLGSIKIADEAYIGNSEIGRVADYYFKFN